MINSILVSIGIGYLVISSLMSLFIFDEYASKDWIIAVAFLGIYKIFVNRYTVNFMNIKIKRNKSV